MRKTKLGKVLNSGISTEDIDPGIEAIGDMEINEETNLLDMNETVTETNEISGLTDDGLEAVIEVQEQVCVIEACKEPTTEMFKILESKHAIACQFFGMNRRNVSCESLSREGFMDTVKESVKKMIELIKSLIKTAGLKLKEIYARLMAHYVKEDTEITEMLNVLRNVSSSDSKLMTNGISAEKVSAILNDNPVVVALCKSTSHSKILDLTDGYLGGDFSPLISKTGQVRIRGNYIPAISLKALVENRDDIFGNPEYKYSEYIILSVKKNKINVLIIKNSDEVANDSDSGIVDLNYTSMQIKSTESEKIQDSVLSVVEVTGLLNEAAKAIKMVPKTYSNNKDLMAKLNMSMSELAKTETVEGLAQLRVYKKLVPILSNINVDKMMCMLYNIKIVKAIAHLYIQDLKR